MQSVYYLFLRFALRRSCKLCRTSGVMAIDGKPSGMMNLVIHLHLPSRKSSISCNTPRRICSLDFFSPAWFSYKWRMYAGLTVTIYCLSLCIFIVLYKPFMLLKLLSSVSSDVIMSITSSAVSPSPHSPCSVSPGVQAQANTIDCSPGLPLARRTSALWQWWRCISPMALRVVCSRTSAP